MPSSQQQHSSDSMENNNGDNKSLVSTGVGAQEKFVLLTVLLEKGASRLGMLVCVWMVLMLVQGGIFVTVETKDRVFVTVLFFLVCFRCLRYFCPQYIWSLTEPTQSLSADNIQQLVIPIGFISRLFYQWNLVSVTTCVVLSMMQLASQDFGQKEVANKGARDFVLNVFYGLAFAEVLVLLIARTFVTIMAVQRKVRKALIEWLKPSQPAQATDGARLLGIAPDQLVDVPGFTSTQSKRPNNNPPSRPSDCSSSRPGTNCPPIHGKRQMTHDM